MDFFSGPRSLLATLCTGAVMYFSWGQWQLQQAAPPVAPVAPPAVAAQPAPQASPAPTPPAPAPVGAAVGQAIVAPVAPVAPVINVGAAVSQAIAPAPAPTLAPGVVDRHAIQLSGAGVEADARLGNAFLLAGVETDANVMLSVRGVASEGDASAAPAPSALTLVIDRSGSMKGDRLRHARSAAANLIHQLNDGDRLSIVTYNSGAEVLLEPVTIDAGTRQRAVRVLDAIEPRGGTCISCGLEQAQRLALALVAPDRGEMLVHDARGRVRMRPRVASLTTQPFARRVILLSDGKPDPDRGEVTRQALLSLSRSMEQRGATLSTVGVGLDYNERIMREVASAGQGNHHFVARAQDLSATLSTELASLKRVAARRVVATFRLPQGTQFAGGFDRDFRFDPATRTVQVSLGDIPAGEERTALFTVKASPIKAHDQTIAEVTLRFEDLSTGRVEQLTGAVAMRITADPAQVALGEDAEVAARREQAIINRQLEIANDELRRGDIDAAEQRIDRQWQRSTRANVRWKNRKLKGNLGRLERMRGGLGALRSEPSPKRRRAVKEIVKSNAVHLFEMDR